MIGEFVAALTFLTRLPIGSVGDRAWPPPGRCIWAYPLVGALVGAIGGGVVDGARAIGLAPLLAALLAVAAMVVVTGALHEDGLADLADGFGGGGTRARKLEIMRDSRVGSFGVLALVLAVGLRAAALAAMTRPWAALIAAGALSRAALLIPMLWLTPARAEGLGAALGPLPPRRTAAAFGIALLASFLALPPGAALRGSVTAAVVGVAVAGLASRQIGGYTGDVLGAAASVAETAVLIALT